jgi:hypothetical protein
MKDNISLFRSFVLGLGFVAVACHLQAAGVDYTEVDLLHELNFSTPYFANASWYNTLTLTIAPGSSGSQYFHFDLYPDNQGLTFFATGAVSIDQTAAPPGTASVTLHVTANGAGTFGLHELAPPYYSSGDYVFTPDPLEVYTDTATGRRELDFVAPSGSNLNIDAGTTWRTTVSMPGDWSSSSSGNVYGTHVLEGYDPLWTVTSNFVYNRATNQTVFSLVNTNYPGVGTYDDGPYPEFYLVGQAAPEPGQIGLASVGLMLFGRFLWKQRRCRPSVVQQQ